MLIVEETHTVDAVGICENVEVCKKAVVLAGIAVPDEMRVRSAQLTVPAL